MISKTTQPTLINWPSNNLPYNAKFTKCGDSESSFSFESYTFSNSCLLFLCSWERGFSIGNSGILHSWDPLTLHHKQMIFCEEIHTLIIHLAMVHSVMASNAVDGL